MRRILLIDRYYQGNRLRYILKAKINNEYTKINKIPPKLNKYKQT